MSLLPLSLDVLIAKVLILLNVKDLSAFCRSCSSYSPYFGGKILYRALDNSLPVEDRAEFYFSLLIKEEPNKADCLWLRFLLEAHPEWANNPLLFKFSYLVSDMMIKEQEIMLPLEVVQSKRALLILLQAGADIRALLSDNCYSLEEVIEAHSQGRMESISFTTERGIFTDLPIGMYNVYLGKHPEMARIAIKDMLKESNDNSIHLFLKSMWSMWTEFMMLTLPSILAAPKYNLLKTLKQFRVRTNFQLSQYFPIRELLSVPGTEVFSYQEVGSNSPTILRLIAHYRPIVCTAAPSITVIPPPDPSILGFPQTADYLSLYLLHQQCPLPLWENKKFWQRRGYENREACLRGETIPVLRFRYYKEYALHLDYHQGRGFLGALSFLFPLSSLNMRLLILREKVTDLSMIKSIYGLMEGNIAHLQDDLRVCAYILKLKQGEKEWSLQYDHPDFAQGVLLACDVIGDGSIEL